MEDENEMIFRRYRSDIHSMCAAFPEPASANKIKMEFQDNFDDTVPFRKFGYQTFDAFLNDHPGLVRVSHEGHECYKAKMTAATQDIQILISQQRKKKEKDFKKKKVPQMKGRGSMLPIGGYNRSSFAIRNLPNLFDQPGRRTNRGGKSSSFSTRASNIFPLPDNSVRVGTVTPVLSKNVGYSLRKSELRSNFSSKVSITKPIPLITRTSLPSLIMSTEKEEPSTGVRKIMQALDKCGGKATLTKLNWAYQSLFGRQLNAVEMVRYFGTKNMRKIHDEHLSEKVELNPGYGGQWSFLSKEIAQKQKEWEASHIPSIVEAPQYKWAFPSLKELYDKTVNMLVNMYPETIPHVALTPTAIGSHKLSGVPCYSSQKVSKVKRVTADDLGLEYSDEEVDEEDDDDDSLQISVPSLPTTTDDDDLDLNSRPQGSPFHLDQVPLPPLPQSSTRHAEDLSLGKYKEYVMSSDRLIASSDKEQTPVKTASPKPQRKSIFDRVRAPTKDVNISLKIQTHKQQTNQNVFEYSANAHLRDNRLTPTVPTRPSVFDKVRRDLNQRSNIDDVQEQMNKLELMQREDRMDILLAEAKENQKEFCKPPNFGSNSFDNLRGPVTVPVKIGKIDFSSPLDANKTHKRIIFDKEEHRAVNQNGPFTTGPQNARAPLEGRGKTNSVVTDSNLNSTSSSPVKNQVPSFSQRFEPFFISPGPFNVKFNGKSEQLSNAVRSRRSIFYLPRK